MAILQPVLACLAAVALHIVLRKIAWRRRSRGYKLPPSHPGYPLIGNMLEIPNNKEALVYKQWGRELNSDIISADAAGTTIVVVNSAQLATEMLETKSSIYSGRPPSIMLNDLMGWHWAIPNMPYGNAWRERRKLFTQQLFQSTANKVFIRNYSQEQISELLVKLYDSPADYRTHIRHMVGAFAISVAFGLPIQATHDPYIKAAEAALKSSGEAVIPGAFYVDFLPFLRYVPEWFPGGGFQKKAREWRAEMEEMRDKPFADCEKRIAAGISPPSFVSAALESIDPDKDVAHQRQLIVETSGMVYAAASDTTTSTLATFFLAMTCYPEIQKKAQTELDRVLGGRVPEAHDETEGQLPYITAIVKEVLRWKPATPIGVPHRSDKDDVFHGYFIPKGTTIIANQWAMLHNEEDYPNPEEFIPERFLNKDGTLNDSVRDPSTIAFGFGRRECPGSHIAKATIWLTAASVLTLFDISKPLNSKGEPIEPTREYGPGIIPHAEPFGCVIKPRSKRAEEAIKSIQANL